MRPGLRFSQPLPLILPRCLFVGPDENECHNRWLRRLSRVHRRRSLLLPTDNPFHRRTGRLDFCKLSLRLRLITGKENTMRGQLAATALTLTIALVGAFGTPRQPNMSTSTDLSSSISSSVGTSVVVARRCRCVERRWNGSCKRRLCRDHW